MRPRKTVEKAGDLKEAVNRIYSSIKIVNGCWEWQKCITSAGYGVAWFFGKMNYVHRISIFLFKGEKTNGLDVDHLCNNPKCCNPEHLEAVTHRENVIRGRGFSGKNMRKKTCPNGHEYSHYYINPNSGIKGRRCGICLKETNRLRYV